jgi:nitroimidazol reductase NimA-like FMN-containing flavoprotein (pyridoxamine 5'-phosphate oxidase superfamily)
MAVLDPRTWLEQLPEAECWRLLRLSNVARLAVVIDDEVTIWPLNIAVDGRVIVFRTGPGTKLATLMNRPKVALEVDGLNFDEQRGWSVVATGHLRPLAGEDLVRAQHLPLAPWTVGEKAFWFGLHVERLSGREIGDRAAAR